MTTYLIRVARSVRRCAASVLILGVAAGLCASAAAEEKAVAGTSVGSSASMERRPAPGQPWRIVMKGEQLPAGDLLVGGPEGSLLSKNGAVRLTMLTDFGGTSPFPVIEAAVVLRDAPGVDLDFVLDRGRVDVINAKPQGPATVRFQVRQDTWDLTLARPGDRVALELYRALGCGDAVRDRADREDHTAREPGDPRSERGGCAAPPGRYPRPARASRPRPGGMGQRHGPGRLRKQPGQAARLGQRGSPADSRGQGPDRRPRSFPPVASRQGVAGRDR